MIAKGVQRWGADIAALIIEQLRLCSELNWPLGKTGQPLCTPCLMTMACSRADWPQRGAVTTTQAGACFLPEGTGGLTTCTSFYKEHSDKLVLTAVSVCIYHNLAADWCLWQSVTIHNYPFLFSQFL